jgi:hypothetical protein
VLLRLTSRLQVEDPMLTEQIEHLLSLDIRVYAFAKDLFHQRLRVLRFMRQHYRYC